MNKMVNEKDELEAEAYMARLRFRRKVISYTLIALILISMGSFVLSYLFTPTV